MVGILLYISMLVPVSRAWMIMRKAGEGWGGERVMILSAECFAKSLFTILLFSSTEVDDMIRKSTNLLLTRTLSNCLQNVIKRKNVGLTEVGRGSGTGRQQGFGPLGFITAPSEMLLWSISIKYLVGNQKWNRVVLLCEARNTLPCGKEGVLLLLFILPLF